MIDKLEAIKKRFEEVGQLIVQPDAMSDMKKYAQLNKEYSDLEKIVKKYDAYQHVLDNIKSAKGKDINTRCRLNTRLDINIQV